jgi:hypothetical protein
VTVPAMHFPVNRSICGRACGFTHTYHVLVQGLRLIFYVIVHDVT